MQGQSSQVPHAACTCASPLPWIVCGQSSPVCCLRHAPVLLWSFCCRQHAGHGLHTVPHQTGPTCCLQHGPIQISSEPVFWPAPAGNSMQYVPCARPLGYMQYPQCWFHSIHHPQCKPSSSAGVLYMAQAPGTGGMLHAALYHMTLHTGSSEVDPACRPTQ